MGHRGLSWFNRGSGFVVLLALLFLFRFYYGLSMDFWKDDERQIYLLGLQWFTTGSWPFFGPDVIHTNQQIAGALQPLLVGVPLRLWSQPEAPILFLNMLSFAGLYLLASCLVRLVPEAPRALVFVWLFTMPWTLNVSAHVYNPSYLLVASCLFFVAFIEIIPTLKTGLMAPGTAFFCMGLALAWNIQLHLSWPLLLPFIWVAVVVAWRARLWRWRFLGLGAGGFALFSLLLLPTAMKYGVASLVTPIFANSRINAANAYQPLTIMARFLSFGAYELPRFVTEHSEQRLGYLLARPWLLGLAVIVGVVGVVQPLLFLWGLFRQSTPRAMRWLIVGSIAEICLAFVTSSRPPTARNYYILFPVAAVAAAYGLRFMMASATRRRVAIGMIGLGMAYQGLLAASHFAGPSLYHDRDRVVEAIKRHDYRVVGERRVTELPPALW